MKIYYIGFFKTFVNWPCQSSVKEQLGARMGILLPRNSDPVHEVQTADSIWNNEQFYVRKKAQIGEPFLDWMNG